MAASFRVQATCGSSRAGLFLGVLETPGALLQTTCGSPSGMPPPSLVGLGQAKAGVIAARYGQLAVEACSMDGVDRLVNATLDGKWPEARVLLTHRDPAQFPPLPIGSHRGKKDDPSLSVEGWFGRRKVTARSLMKDAATIKATAVALPCAELEASCGRRKHSEAVEKTKDIVLASLDELKSCPGHAPELLVPVVGGADTTLRAASAKYAAAVPDAAGFVLSGLGLGETRECRNRCISASLECLPSHLPRVLVGPGDIVSVLDAVAAGVDVIDTDWPNALAAFGHALALRLPGDEEAAALAADRAGEGGWGERPVANSLASSSTASLAAATAVPTSDDDPILGSGGPRWMVHSVVSHPALALDRRPLVPGCQCPTCAGMWTHAAHKEMKRTGYSRAYIHHLWATNELLGQTLLAAHNAFRYRHFLGCVRDAVQAGTFESFRGELVRVHGLAK
jgi:hypothetical protein